MLSRLILTSLLLTTVVCLVVGPASAADWGTLTGTFLIDGDAPAAKELKPTKDLKFCGKHKIPDESLLVDAQSKGIANVLVYVRNAPAKVHPNYEETASAVVKLDNAKCRFEPHVCLLRTTQTVAFGNKDGVGHNTKIDTFINTPINPLIPVGGTVTHQFSDPERLPASVSCSIHPWMTAKLLIQDHPYFAKTNQHGEFEIKNLPTGEELEIQFWHETSGYVKKVSGATADVSKKGRVKLTLDGDFDLGTIKVDPKSFD